MRLSNFKTVSIIVTILPLLFSSPNAAWATEDWGYFYPAAAGYWQQWATNIPPDQKHTYVDEYGCSTSTDDYLTTTSTGQALQSFRINYYSHIPIGAIIKKIEIYPCGHKASGMPNAEIQVFYRYQKPGFPIYQGFSPTYTLDSVTPEILNPYLFDNLNYYRTTGDKLDIGVKRISGTPYLSAIHAKITWDLN